MFKENFDFVAFVSWFESLIDFILALIEKIKTYLPTTTTTTVAEETPVE